MGIYLNPGSSGFERILNSDYVDKTGLIEQINNTIGKTKNLTCISRPRRFGKSFAAQMLCAYYDKTCDSHALFDNLGIAGSAAYEEHINKYDVIYMDMAQILTKSRKTDTIDFIIEKITDELLEAYSSLKADSAFSAILANAVEYTGNKFVMIIDEWDAPIRERPQIGDEYLKFLRMLFKSSGTTAKIFAAAYMTGILPIKKNGSQSAVSDFREFSMIKPRKYGEYVGFTEEEVQRLCEKNDVDFQSMKQWYDG